MVGISFDLSNVNRCLIFPLFLYTMYHSSMRILGIESSCDETSAALVTVDERVLTVESLATSTSMGVQAMYGGVVPEVAARKQMDFILPVLDEALKPLGARDGNGIDLIAVTSGPGLMTSLAVGVEAAKTLGTMWGKPVVGVNHLEGHVLSPLFSAGLYPLPESTFPVIVLTVSGGHSMLVLMEAVGRYSVLGSTIDDAAGDAFDKVGKMLGLPYPGGPQIDKLSKLGKPDAFAFPRALMQHSHYNFSFSGLKTSVKYAIRDLLAKPGRASAELTDQEKADIAASFQRAVIDALARKTMRAVKAFGVKTIFVAGGVAANSELRERMEAEAKKHGGIRAICVERKFSGDNAAMIALAGYEQWKRQEGEAQPFDLDPKKKL